MPTSLAGDAPLLDASTFARWLGYVALFVMVGVSALQLLARRLGPGEQDVRMRIRDRARRLGLGAAIGLLVSCALRLYLQARAVSDPGLPFDWGSIEPIVRATTWGHGWAWQAGAAIASIGGFALARYLQSGWALAWLGAVVSIGAAVLTGHASEHPWGTVPGVALQAVHLLAGAMWLGTLGAIVAIAYPAVRGDERRERVLATIVNGYSPVALAGGLVAIGAGVVLAFAYVGSLAALSGSGYGRALLLKVVLLFGVAGTGAYNWRRVRPVMGAEPGAERLRRSATVELALGTLLLAVTAVLVALPAEGLG